MNHAAPAAFDFARKHEFLPDSEEHTFLRWDKTMKRKKQEGFSLIELLIVVAIIGIIAAIAVPRLMVAQQAAHETAALGEVQTLGKSQVLYSITKGHGKFGTLADLGAQGMIDSVIASGNKGGYVYVTTPVTTEGLPPMFDTTAHPSSVGTFGTGNRSFYSNESNVVFETEGITPPSATPQDRVPKNGTPIQ
jgi:prepilin-type N-terminal cleavage/methylation domain-containing protein